MEFENLIKLIETVSKSELATFQYEEKGIKIKLGKENGQTVSLPGNNKSLAGEDAPVKKTESAKTVKSPLVGTFYTAPSETAEPFVSVGDTVKKGQTLAIVEAMKLMNEIESDFDGVIEEVLVENGQPVEYNQPLFRLK